MTYRILLILSFLLSPFFTWAMVSPDSWTYVFHLEYTQGQLKPNTNEEFFVDTLPVEYTKGGGAGEYRARIIGVKGQILTDVYFNEPSTYLPTKQKYILDLEAPYFANADRVDFSKNEALIFSMSLKGTAFCNENGLCDTQIGENNRNCSMDCPVPQVPSEDSAFIDETKDESPQEVITPSAPEPPSEFDTPGTTIRSGGGVSPQSIIPLVVGVLLVLIAITGVIVMKRRQS